ncbi:MULTISPECIES: hypothetical protein [Frankia]|uniref:Uncharacterized protein n=1 Tax=Frankia alni (strain DSM 45986 / CECT 9034 / ACN14a) TaxID=326424 RepID=Q0REQ0_FRAAA|nr:MULTISPECIES: hypothetical protein [Frankia]CAJ64057.1 hypothetical protein; putative signal peptide [Frankia alni ACN14a]
MSSAPPHQPRTTRILLTLIAVLLGVIAALTGTLLQIADHASVPAAIQCGACAFAGTVMLALTVLHFLTDNGI